MVSNPGSVSWLPDLQRKVKVKLGKWKWDDRKLLLGNQSICKTKYWVGGCGNLEKSRMFPSLKLFLTPEGRVASSCMKNFQQSRYQKVLLSLEGGFLAFTRLVMLRPCFARRVSASPPSQELIAAEQNFWFTIFTIGDFLVNFEHFWGLNSIWWKVHLVKVGDHQQLVWHLSDNLVDNNLTTWSGGTKSGELSSDRRWSRACHFIIAISSAVICSGTNDIVDE